ncbi:orotidine-5'-phosphate decarboxylase [Serratia ureilytica]
MRDLHGRGFDVFLDLKFHDIPNTTAHAVAAAAELGVWMVNVHASGGARMMTAAKEALLPGADAPLLIAVTVLTSMEAEDLRGIGIEASPAEHAEHLARGPRLRAGRRGLFGTRSAAPEGRLRAGFPAGYAGIRPEGSAAGDQRRIAPVQAQAAGVDYMVIGRPITQSADPAATLRAIRPLGLRKQ